MSIEHTCDECNRFDADKCICERCLEKIEEHAYEQGRSDYKEEVEKDA